MWYHRLEFESLRSKTMNLEAKKSVLRMFQYGLLVVTAQHGEDGVASTVTWVTQCSFDPPLVAVAIKRGTRTFDMVQAAGAFAINVIGVGQQEIASMFFKHVGIEGDKIGELPFTASVTGSPILVGLPGYVECKVVEFVNRGDHPLFVAEVVEAGVQNSLLR
jgi:flavin reductase (DIM6/NTAB) family NADH-FMN oxidoreductase RutF